MVIPGGTAPLGNTWYGWADAQWSNGTNWSSSPPPSAGETAIFNNAGNGNTTIDLGAGVAVHTVLFDQATVGAYTIGSGGAGAQG